MTRKLIEEPIGEARLIRAQRNAQLDAHNARVLAAVIRDTATDDREQPTLSRLGDELQLRGIPAIGRGVRGAINGTIPGNGTPR